MKNKIGFTNKMYLGLKTKIGLYEKMGDLLIPSVLVTLIFLILIVFQVKITPLFIGLLPLQQWPSNAKVLYNWSKLFYDNWLVILSVIGVIGFVISIPMNKVGKH